MELIVQKFGGTSLDTTQKIRDVARRIQQESLNSKLVVVVSAMGQTTDELMEKAREISSNPPRRELDMLLTTGERVSMALLSIALNSLGVKAVSYTGSQCGIITSDSHSNARIVEIKGERIRESLEQGYVVIVAGFQGVSRSREITTLGRGGSDTTAVALAGKLKASRCEIYTDVGGIYSGDPRLLSQANHLPTVSYEFMERYARLGAGVLHPRAVQLARKFSVRVRVAHSDLKAGDRRYTLVEDNGTMEESTYHAVTHNKDLRWVNLGLARTSVFYSVTEMLLAEKIDVEEPHFNGEKFSFFTQRDRLEDLDNLLKKLKNDGFVSSQQIYSDVLPVSVIGCGLNMESKEIMASLSDFAKESIDIYFASSHATTMTFAVRDVDSQEALKILHHHCVEGATQNES